MPMPSKSSPVDKNVAGYAASGRPKTAMTTDILKRRFPHKQLIRRCLHLRPKTASAAWRNVKDQGLDQAGHNLSTLSIPEHTNRRSRSPSSCGSYAHGSASPHPSPRPCNASNTRQLHPTVSSNWRSVIQVQFLDLDEHGDAASARMSTPELPPIGRPRPLSSTSRRSNGSKNSRGSGTLPKGTIMKYEKPLLISMENLSNGKKSKSPLSPTSTASSTHTDTGSHTNNANNGFLKFRAKSWCVPDHQKHSNMKLETDYNRSGTTFNGYNEHSNGAGKGSSTPRTRQHSVSGNSGSSWGALTKTKRTTSFGNLTRLSDQSNNTPTNNVPKRRPANKKGNSSNSLKKFNSEQNLAKMDGSITSRSVRPAARRTTFDKPPIHTKLKATRSQPVFTHIEPDPIPKSQDMQNDTTEQEYDSDTERNSRIMKWLIGVEESAERPPSPHLTEDEPQQTDTAIHVVYGN